MVDPIVASPTPRASRSFFFHVGIRELMTMANVISLIMSPAFEATIVAPTIVSVPFLVWTRTKPSSSLSRIARSTPSKGCV